MLSSRSGTTNEARNVAGYLCRRLSGETLARIEKEFRLNIRGSVSSVMSSSGRNGGLVSVVDDEVQCVDILGTLSCRLS